MPVTTNPIGLANRAALTSQMIPCQIIMAALTVPMPMAMTPSNVMYKAPHTMLDITAALVRSQPIRKIF
ncbi:hypothetical protein D3C78_1845360 [compost metagenome]